MGHFKSHTEFINENSQDQKAYLSQYKQFVADQDASMIKPIIKVVMTELLHHMDFLYDDSPPKPKEFERSVKIFTHDIYRKGVKTSYSFFSNKQAEKFISTITEIKPIEMYTWPCMGFSDENAYMLYEIRTEPTSYVWYPLEDTMFWLHRYYGIDPIELVEKSDVPHFKRDNVKNTLKKFNF